jgi:uncharacterized protein (TIGR02646 family)
MLNITSRLSISRRSSRFISALKRRQNGSFTQASWGMIHNSVKNEISGNLFANQGLKCVYCERYLIGLGHEIDHFAHKGDYPQFSFTAVNLFYSCKLCNSLDRKGQKNTINVLNARYNQCAFLIVHPYYHDPSVEIIYTDPDRIYFDRVNSTQLGNDTIDFFNWEDLLYTTIRSRILVNERMNPLTSIVERELIQLSISYKK